MKRAVLYLRVSTIDRQNPETQGIELRQFAELRGYEVVQEYVDHGVSGTKVRRPALDQLLKDAHRRKFDAVLVWSCDRLARSTKHFLEVLDELNELVIQFHSQREAIDTEGPLGRAIVVIISAIAELERSLIVERVRAGMRRAKLEGRRLGGDRLMRIAWRWSETVWLVCHSVASRKSTVYRGQASSGLYRKSERGTKKQRTQSDRDHRIRVLFHAKKEEQWS
jgi:DNA invertase Pin-like site-specific DNA recombinase